MSWWPKERHTRGPAFPVGSLRVWKALLLKSPKWLCWDLSGKFGRKKRERPRGTRGHLDSSSVIMSNFHHFHALNSIHFCPFSPECICYDRGYHFKLSDAGFPVSVLVVLSSTHDLLWDLSFYSAAGFGEPWTPFPKSTADKELDKILALLAKKGVAAAIKVLRIPGGF